MPIINKGTSFSNGEQLTAEKINNLVDDATFDQSATDSASTTVNSTGQIIVADGGITPSKISSGGPSWDAGGQLRVNGDIRVGLNTGSGSPFTSINATRVGTTDTLIISSDNDIKFNASTINSEATTHNFKQKGGTQLMQLDSIGRLLLGTTTSPTAMTHSVFCTGRMGSLNTYSQTTASSANVVIGSTGLFQRSTSSARYKENVQDYEKGIDAVKSLRPVTYESINEDDDSTYAGFIAEEVHEAGLPEFVDYNAEGQPDALHYANMTALLTKALQEAIARIEVLEAK